MLHNIIPFAMILLKSGVWILYAGLFNVIIGGIVHVLKTRGLGKFGLDFLRIGMILIVTGVIIITIAVCLAGGWRAVFIA